MEPIRACLQGVSTVTSPGVKWPGHEAAITVTVLLFDIISTYSPYLPSVSTYEEISVLELVQCGRNLHHQSADQLINWLLALSRLKRRWFIHFCQQEEIFILEKVNTKMVLTLILFAALLDARLWLGFRSWCGKTTLLVSWTQERPLRTPVTHVWFLFSRYVIQTQLQMTILRILLLQSTGFEINVGFLPHMKA